jgi:phenylpyruvate tautomerase PptA (4-oxalocrotonate tautomerase family)
MPLWKVYHPEGLYTADDKQALSASITNIYASIPLPKFYVVMLFEAMPKGCCFVGGKPHDKFVRFKVEQIARTVPVNQRSIGTPDLHSIGTPFWDQAERQRSPRRSRSVSAAGASAVM